MKKFVIYCPEFWLLEKHYSLKQQSVLILCVCVCSSFVLFCFLFLRCMVVRTFKGLPLKKYVWNASLGRYSRANVKQSENYVDRRA